MLLNTKQTFIINQGSSGLERHITLDFSAPTFLSVLIEDGSGTKIDQFSIPEPQAGGMTRILGTIVQEWEK